MTTQDIVSHDHQPVASKAPLMSASLAVACDTSKLGGILDAAMAIYDAYGAKDRTAAEDLLAKDFRFTSPLDNAIDRKSYFAICWHPM